MSAWTPGGRGRPPKGSDKATNKFRTATVRSIQQLHKAGQTQSTIADVLHLSIPTVRKYAQAANVVFKRGRPAAAG